MGLDTEIAALPVWRKVYLFARNIAAGTWDFLTVDANQNLNVNVAAQSVQISVTNITSDSFTASGAGFTFGTVWADVETFSGFGVWVQNATATNAIMNIQFEIADGLAGAGLGALAPFTLILGGVSATQFLVCPFAGGYVFNNAAFQRGKAFRSFRIGIQLTNPNPNQTINLFYRGFIV